MKLGYARVSTNAQDTALQLSALHGADVTAYWEEQQSGVKHRPALEELLQCLGSGDVLVVYKMDRLARSLKDLLRIAEKVAQAGATMESLTEPLETRTPAGRMMFQILGAFAEFERNVIRERCMDGRAEALKRGVRFGRKRTFDYDEAFRLRNEERMTWRAIALRLGVDLSTARRGAVAVGASLAGPGSRASPPSPIGLGPSGNDP